MSVESLLSFVYTLNPEVPIAISESIKILLDVLDGVISTVRPVTVVNVVPVILLWFGDCSLFEDGIHPVDLFAAVIKESQHRLSLDRIALAETEQEVTVSENDTICLILPDTAANLIQVEILQRIQPLGFEEQNAAHSHLA